MALDYTVKYPTQVDVGDPGYPHGKARNQATPNDGTGTPLEKDLVNDIWGLLQSILVQGRTTPSGTPDAVGASQYFDALMKALQPLAVLDWDQPAAMNTLNITPADPSSNANVTIAIDLTGLVADRLCTTPDGGNTWAGVTLASPTGVVMLATAMDPAGTKGIATGAKGGGTDIQTSSALGSYPLGAWAPITPPGTPTSLACALFDPVNSRFIVTGKTGAAPYIATCALSDLTTWTQRTVPASITGSKDSCGLTRIGNTIVASWDDQTKVAYSTDGGLTWTASTTTLTSGRYVVLAGETQFLAVDKTSTRVYVSSDGITWTLQPAFSRAVLDFRRWDLQFLGGVFVFKTNISANPYFYYSKDYGATWSRTHNENRPWASQCVVRNRLLQIRLASVGPDFQAWVERSRAIALP